MVWSELYGFNLNLMSEELKNKASANAKHFRYLSRALTFQRNRKGPEELDYLKHYSP